MALHRWDSEVLKAAIELSKEQDVEAWDDDGLTWMQPRGELLAWIKTAGLQVYANCADDLDSDGGYSPWTVYIPDDGRICAFKIDAPHEREISSIIEGRRIASACAPAACAERRASL